MILTAKDVAQFVEGKLQGEPGCEIVNVSKIHESKKGDLKGFRVHKFSFKKHQFLIAYRFQEPDIVFFMIGPHENFYRELKRYLREVES